MKVTDRLAAFKAGTGIYSGELPKRDAPRPHKNPEWDAWYNAVRRCHDERHPQRENYGGRGITVCDAWRCAELGFGRFIAHIGRRPTAAHSLDRIDNNRGYEPGNVRWATKAEQSANRRKPKPRAPRTYPKTEWSPEVRALLERSPESDLNGRPAHYECAALPAELSGQVTNLDERCLSEHSATSSSYESTTTVYEAVESHGERESLRVVIPRRTGLLTNRFVIGLANVATPRALAPALVLLAGCSAVATTVDVVIGFLAGVGVATLIVLLSASWRFRLGDREWKWGAQPPELAPTQPPVATSPPARCAQLGAGDKVRFRHRGATWIWTVTAPRATPPGAWNLVTADGNLGWALPEHVDVVERATPKLRLVQGGES